MLKTKLFQGLLWSGIEKFLLIAVQLLIEIVMARMIAPKEYGLMGILLMVIALSQVLVDSGFGNALIYRKDRDEADFSTAFYSTFFIGLVLYIFVFVFSKQIASYFNADISLLLRIGGLTIIFNSLSVIYKTKLSINIDFKSQTKYSFAAIAVSGIVGIAMAYSGYGLWSLVAQTLLFSVFSVVLLYANMRWLPTAGFSFQKFKGLFSYSSKLLYAGVLNSLYVNANSFLLGKFFPVRELGLYSKSYQFTVFPVSVVTFVVQRVFFPFYASLKDKNEELFETTLKVNKLQLLIFAPVLSFLFIFASDFISFFLTDSWMPMLNAFRILLGAAVFYPLVSINMNVFQITGRTDIFFLIEVVVIALAFVGLFFLYPFGIIGVCVALLLKYFLQFFITSVAVSRNLMQSFWRFSSLFYCMFSILVITFIGDEVCRFYIDSYLRFALVIPLIIFSYIIVSLLFFKKEFADISKKFRAQL